MDLQATVIFKHEEVARKAISYMHEVIKEEDAKFSLSKVKGTNGWEYRVIVSTNSKDVKFYAQGFMKGFLRGRETEVSGK